MLKAVSARHHLKHWFVPHHHNNHHPHVIRSHGLAVVAVLVLMLQVVWNMSVGTGPKVLGYATDISADNLLIQTNQQRQAAGLPALQYNGLLAEGALAKAQDMMNANYWAHVSPSGVQPWHWFDQAGYRYSYAGENLAKDFDTTGGVMDGWMNSPQHRANMLAKSYVDVGFAVLDGDLGSGQTTLVVAFYGTPSQIKSTPAAAQVAKATPAPTTTKATPSPTSAPQPASASNTNGNVAGVTLAPTVARQYSLFAPLAITRTLNWGAMISLLLLAILFVIFAVTHITVWRRGLRRWQKRHYRMWAAGELGGVALIMIMIVSSSFGAVR